MTHASVFSGIGGPEVAATMLGWENLFHCDQDRQRTDQLDSLIKIMESQVSEDGKVSRLSPLFTEEMMGFPLMWTALPFLSESGAPKPSKPTATPSSPK